MALHTFSFILKFDIDMASCSSRPGGTRRRVRFSTLSGLAFCCLHLLDVQELGVMRSAIASGVAPEDHPVASAAPSGVASLVFPPLSADSVGSLWAPAFRGRDVLIIGEIHSGKGVDDLRARLRAEASAGFLRFFEEMGPTADAPHSGREDLEDPRALALLCYLQATSAETLREELVHRLEMVLMAGSYESADLREQAKRDMRLAAREIMSEDDPIFETLFAAFDGFWAAVQDPAGTADKRSIWQRLKLNEGDPEQPQPHTFRWHLKQLGEEGFLTVWLRRITWMLRERIILTGDIKTRLEQRFSGFSEEEQEELQHAGIRDERSSVRKLVQALTCGHRARNRHPELSFRQANRMKCETLDVLIRVRNLLWLVKTASQLHLPEGVSATARRSGRLPVVFVMGRKHVQHFAARLRHILQHIGSNYTRIFETVQIHGDDPGPVWQFPLSVSGVKMFLDEQKGGAGDPQIARIEKLLKAWREDDPKNGKAEAKATAAAQSESTASARRRSASGERRTSDSSSKVSASRRDHVARMASVAAARPYHDASGRVFASNYAVSGGAPAVPGAAVPWDFDTTTPSSGSTASSHQRPPATARPQVANVLPRPPNKAAKGKAKEAAKRKAKAAPKR